MNISHERANEELRSQNYSESNSAAVVYNSSIWKYAILKSRLERRLM